ncbi:MAG: hypothetical protein MJZ28_04950 [Paludibacteraceae bacterium]|nr:hypothetical protein [Paludibacteraceae bacterium]
MTEDERKLMYRLVGRVQSMLDSNAEMRSECERLKAELANQKKLNSEYKAECDRLKTQCENLKFAKVMSVTDSEADKAKRRLSNLVREIDKCISLLNK